MSFRFASASLHQSQLVKIPIPESVDLFVQQSPMHAGQDGTDFRRHASRRLEPYHRASVSASCFLSLWSN